MSKITFRPIEKPYPAWMGPYSPARGNTTGFRFHQERLGTWSNSEYGRSFWVVQNSQASKAITTLVRRDWGGGRVLFLPTGHLVKPLQGDEERGKRVLIGQFEGPIVLQKPDGTLFDMSNPGGIQPGQPWPGPTTIGLECVIKNNGSLTCNWYHPSEWGQDMISEQVHKPDRALAAGFKKARPGTSAGRVRITANGHVITNRKKGSRWVSMYVGHIAKGSLTGWDKWIGRQ